MSLRVALSLATLAACGSQSMNTTPHTPDPDRNGTDEPTPPGPVGAWEDCEPLTIQMAAGPECLTYDVPLRWSEVDSEPTLQFTVFRYLTDDPEPQGQIWALDGGPGGTGAGPGNPDFVGHMNALGFDVYIPSQRGTSGVDALSCTNAHEWASCHAQLVDAYTLEGLAGFATSEAALDTSMALGDADDGTPQYLFGTSYGTYLAMRILQIDEEIDGVVLDSSMTYEPDIWNAGLYADDLLMDLFAACSEDTTCAAHFPGSIEDAIALVADPTHCPEVPVDGRGRLIGFTTQLAGVIPLGLTARLARCAPEDVQVFARVEYLFGRVPPTASWVFPPEEALNEVVYNLVVVHDFLPPLTQSVFDQALVDASDLVFGDAVAALNFWDMKTSFPIADGFVADTTVPAAPPPVLVLQGGQDLQTPSAWGQRAAESLGGTLVTVPGAGHGVYPQDTCAKSVTDAFLADPTAQLDLTCVDALGGPSLVAPTDPYFLGFIQFALGVDEIWPSP